MQILIVAIVYLSFFFSGAAALIYEVVWVRYLSHIFGGSHLAVTAVLSVIMGGLALGSYLIGRRARRETGLLRLYGFLEIGVAAFALVFFFLIKIYPAIYVPLAQVAVTSPLYLSFLRIVFAFIALIVPTTLMGGTLPVLSAFVSRRARSVGVHLSFLYGFNTLGAVIGAFAAGFIFLPNYSVSSTLAIPMLINGIIGLVAIGLQDKAEAVLKNESPAQKEREDTGALRGDPAENPRYQTSFRLVLWGIGLSGFCALGYEVLWTRVLSIVIGASVYGFTLILMAFLAGIALGSASFGLFVRLRGSGYRNNNSPVGSIAAFGAVQVIIGISALLVTANVGYLPMWAESLREFVSSISAEPGRFTSSQLAHFGLAFSFFFVPAFFMGIAFPLAGKVHALSKKIVGRAVGDVLAYNTVGAILGSALSGFVLIYFIGMQRSLQALIMINIGFGLIVIMSVLGRRRLTLAASAAVTISLLLVVFGPWKWQIWNTKFYAIYQANHPDAYKTREKIRRAMANTDVLYYGEGIESIVSSIQTGESWYFITNGRVEASNSISDMQCQYTLGHLPMLLHKDPKKVFVLGAGSGMTLGATSVYPGVEQITLAEIEPKVLGVTRTFGIYNHYVLDNPKLRIVFNDGRNFLMTTKEKFDVITADPIHPWFSGAGYLYSNEYFRIAARHLNPGGIVCQWLPIYELTEQNLKSVVRTFRENFAYTMIWLTNTDAEVVGSNAPIVLDEDALERRIRQPEVLQDLRRVGMGSAEDFLGYFLMGNAGVDSYSQRGVINTDDNVYLEFSAPRSLGKGRLAGANYFDLGRYRENILPYLLAPRDRTARGRQKERWKKNMAAAALFDQARALFLEGRQKDARYEKIAAELDSLYPAYAPWRSLKEEVPDKLTGEPRVLKQVGMKLLDESGKTTELRLSAVMLRTETGGSVIFFVDGRSKVVFGKLRAAGTGPDARLAGVVDDMLNSITEVYTREQNAASASGEAYPSQASVFPKIRNIVEVKAEQGNLP